MLKYIRRIIGSFLFSIVFSIAFVSQVYAAQIDINTADAATLAQSITGIGPSKAQAIVDYREANGPYATPDDLVQVQGIGFKTLDRIREFVTVTPVGGSSTTDSVEAASSASESPATELQPGLQAN